jgi:hypothetical protein
MKRNLILAALALLATPGYRRRLAGYDQDGHGRTAPGPARRSLQVIKRRAEGRFLLLELLTRMVNQLLISA